MTEEEKGFIEQAQNGDSAAFGVLYDRYAERIYRFIFLKTGHKSDAEDLLHEVFLAGWRTIHGYELRGGIPFTSWLYRIAGNRVIDWYRTRKSTSSLDEMMESNTFPIELASTGHTALLEALDRGLAMDAVIKGIRALNETEQTILLMRYVEDLSPEEVGHATGKTAGAVRLIQHRALTKLKKNLEITDEQPITRTS
jgi:RNA polymerase sigma-70 factor (ECF subfamily)